MWLKRRAYAQAAQGPNKASRQRHLALIMIMTGLARVIVWVALIVLYFAGARFAHTLFNDVWFVAVISLYANAATDWGQVAASLAQLTAGDAHHDAEVTRAAVSSDLRQIDEDIERLADLQPGPDAVALAGQIQAKLQRGTTDAE